MTGPKGLIHELHRRSIWQVVGIFLAASWGVVEVVDFLTEKVGLPDWTPTMALVLLLIGLPIVVATAFVQEGMPGSDGPASPGPGETPVPTPGSTAAQPAHPAAGTASPDRPAIPPSQGRRLLTWRNALLGGLGAFTLLGISIFAYFVMWTSGIGPVGNLVAQGVLEERDPVVLAAFEDATGEGIGEVVTEALRVDLLESPVLSLVTAGQLSQSLQLMDLPTETPLTPALAREVAQRGGFKAIIRGEVALVGTAYVLTAAIVSAESGDELKAFRVTARSNADLVDAIDQLSQNMRESVGESLRNIRAGQPLEQATTSSFEALRDYTAAEGAEARGDYDEALRLLGEAVALDPAFAMAYRKIAVLNSNLGTDPALTRAAAVSAYEHRDRLTDRERYLTEAYYHDNVTGDRAAVEAAYRNALRVAPDDGSALNNLALMLRQRGDYDEAIALLERAVAGPGASAVASWNLSAAHAQAGDADAADAAYRKYVEAYPGHIFANLSRVFSANVRRDSEALHAIMRDMDRAPPGAFRWMGAQAAGGHDVATGRWREGMEHLEESAVISELDERASVALGRRLWARVTLTASIIGDTLGASQALRGFAREFEELDDVTKPWNTLIEAHLAVGQVREARDAFERWPGEVPEGARPEGYAEERRTSSAALLLSEGDFAAAAREMEGLRRESRCPVCGRMALAAAYAELGRTAEAIELLLEEQASFAEPSTYPLTRLAATRRLAPLFESVGDTAAALDQYRLVVDAWGDGDPELQQAVRHARERIAALGGN
ncbi:MAG TPA: tetratricopeptide repeat protein [Longimicrobiales bacterium]|nr:tetratricopeptide repeat protein [Longimicrobiales bacterium]